MRILLILLLLNWNVAFTQKAYMPFELERYSPDIYASALKNYDTNFETELNALEYYFLAYKAQRAVNPENYFPKVDKKRANAATFLRSNFPEGSAVTFIGFLENSGSLESCIALINVTSDYKILLPYQFMGAYLTDNKSLESEYLNKMDQAGMFSDVLKSFGENAMLAIENNTIVISQGMQDLIALKYGANSIGSSVQIANLFAERCEGFKGFRTDEILDRNKNLIWISPSISGSFTQEHKQSLYLWGIGFSLSDNDKFLADAIKKIGRNFAGLTDIPQTPADRGLIQSYSYFAEAYQVYAIEKGDDFDRSKSGKISLYIKNQTE